MKTNLAGLKTEVGKLDFDKLVPVPVALSKLSDVVKSDVVKKNVYDKLVPKVNSIDTNRFILKTNYDADKTELEKKIPDTSGLVKKTDYNTKIAEIESKSPNVSNLATKTILVIVVLLIKQNITLKLQKLKINLIIIIMIDILLLQS